MDAGSNKSNKKTALLQSIRDFGGKLFKLKKVKQEPKVVVVSSDNMDLMSQILARREAIAGEKKSNKFKNYNGLKKLDKKMEYCVSEIS
ncbi:MAG TPA: hypothetical protein LFV92_07805 [Rickettsia endosymbiont of Ceroptres masudai]|nr:hypothetical protein [Rickettsia endosymbiont of Ceroptres masudai]